MKLTFRSSQRTNTKDVLHSLERALDRHGIRELKGLVVYIQPKNDTEIKLHLIDKDMDLINGHDDSIDF